MRFTRHTSGQGAGDIYLAQDSCVVFQNLISQRLVFSLVFTRLRLTYFLSASERLTDVWRWKNQTWRAFSLFLTFSFLTDRFLLILEYFFLFMSERIKSVCKKWRNREKRRLQHNLLLAFGPTNPFLSWDSSSRSCVGVGDRFSIHFRPLARS